MKPLKRKRGRPPLIVSCHWGCGKRLPVMQMRKHEAKCAKRPK